MTPFIHFGVERQRLGAARMLGDDDLCAALVEIGNDAVAVEGFVGDQRAEIEPRDERRHADRIKPVALASVHVVDITRGVPAAGLRVALHRRTPGGTVLLADGTTDAHGKMVSGAEIVAACDLSCGLTLSMDVGAWYGERGEAGFVGVVPFSFRLPDAGFHCHLPAKITPAGLSLFITRSA